MSQLPLPSNTDPESMYTGTQDDKDAESSTNILKLDFLHHGKLVFINFIFTVVRLPWHSSVVLSSVICEYDSMSMRCHCR